MNKTRFDNFSDAVIAIIITIMVLRMKSPADGSLSSVAEIRPLLVTYVLSFLVVAIFWVSHNILFEEVQKISRGIVWANLHFLFWMSLVPLVMAFMGEHHREPLPVAAYGTVFGMTYLAFTLLRREVSKHLADPAKFYRSHEKMFKQNILATFLYFTSIPLSFVSVYISYALFGLIPLSFLLLKPGKNFS